MRCGASRNNSFDRIDSTDMAILAGRHLVIFGCGYVGAAVARWALTEGARVTALTRNAAAAIVLREAGIDTVIANLAGHAWHGEIDAAPELALNCVSSGGGGTEAYRQSYHKGMQSIRAWATQRGPIGTLLYTSSTSVYPQGQGVVVDETTPVAAAAERVQALLDAEAAARATAGPSRRRLLLPLPAPYGPGRPQLPE